MSRPRFLHCVSQGCFSAIPTLLLIPAGVAGSSKGSADLVYSSALAAATFAHWGSGWARSLLLAPPALPCGVPTSLRGVIWVSGFPWDRWRPPSYVLCFKVPAGSVGSTACVVPSFRCTRFCQWCLRFCAALLLKSIKSVAHLGTIFGSVFRFFTFRWLVGSPREAS